MAQGDLTTLANLNAWVGATTDTNEALLGRLITAASTTVTRYLARPFIGSTLLTERYDGRGGDAIALRYGPVTSIVSISFGGSVVTAQATGNPPTGGYLLDATGISSRVVLTDLCFPYGKQQIQVSYWAGWQATDAAQTIASGSPPTLTAAENWLTDVGVTYANGTALTAVASTPARGQYAVALGVYTFNPADVGQSVILTYGTVPFDIEQATLEVAGETYARLDRIGLNSKTLAGQEVISFSQLPINASARLMLQPYRRVAPI